MTSEELELIKRIEDIPEDGLTPKPITESTYDELLQILDNALFQIEEKNEYFDKSRFDLYQREIMMQLFQNYVDDVHSVLVAPTGSGKTLISLLFTYCVSKYHEDLPCTILATDTFLQQQYIESNDIFTGHLIDTSFSMLKGKGQYTCLQTQTPYPQGICAKRKISPIKAFANKEMDCARTCEYVQSYNRAILSNIRVFNYHLYLSYANYVGSHKLLRGNPAIVFDECHKVDDILDGFANTVIGINFLSSLNTMEHSLDVMQRDLSDEFKKQSEKTKEKFRELLKSVIKGGSTATIMNNYIDLLDSLDEFGNVGNLETRMYEDQGGDLKTEVVKHNLTSYMRSIFETYDKLVDKNVEIPPMIQAVYDFSDLYEKAYFLRRAVQGITPDKFVVNYDAQTKSITVANISTSDKFTSLIREHLIGKNMVFMSATVGNAEYYGQYLGLKPEEFRIINVDSMFDFSKSPIVSVQPLISLSNDKKAENLPKMMIRVDNILSIHHDHNGIIHTANKEITKYILENSEHKKRLITYTNAQEKKEAIAKLGKDTNLVIVAYSMEEGVDFKDDLGRFQIITKLSWSYLGDYIVKRKMDIYPEWYEMTTLNKLLQTFGRINRHIVDYGITYIIDTSFSRLFPLMDKITKDRVKPLFYDEVTRDFVKETFQIEK